MNSRKPILFGVIVLSCLTTVLGQEEKKSSYMPVVPTEEFSNTVSRMKAEKPAVMKRQMELLEARYDLQNDPAPNVTMTRGKPVQRGIRVKLSPGTSWEKLAAMTPDEILSAVRN
jgi:cytochrome c peroxidase